MIKVEDKHIKTILIAGAAVVAVIVYLGTRPDTSQDLVTSNNESTPTEQNNTTYTGVDGTRGDFDHASLASRADLTIVGKVVGNKYAQKFVDNSGYDQELVAIGGLEDSTYNQKDFQVVEVIVNNTDFDVKAGDVVPLISIHSPDGSTVYQPNANAQFNEEDSYLVYLMKVRESLRPSYILGSSVDIGVVSDGQVKFLEDGQTMSLPEYRDLVR